MSCYRLGDESGGFCVLGEFAKVRRAGGTSLRSSDRLLHRREAPFEHARSWELFRVHHESGLEPGERIELVANEQFVGSVDGRRAEEFGALQVAGEVQVVGALRVDGDAHAFAVHVLDRADRRTRWNEVACLDLQIRWAEDDLVRARGLVAEESHIPGSGLHRIGQLSGRLEGNELDRNAETLAELPSQIHRDAAILPSGTLLVDEQEILHVDAHAQFPRRRQFRARGGGNLGRHRAGIQQKRSEKHRCKSNHLGSPSEARASRSSRSRISQ